MLQPSDITTYQRNGNAAAGYCAACKVRLHPFETHVCDNCAGKLYKGNGDENTQKPKL